ncbi:FecR family protein [Steroidobacter flavus]|uniref:FecR family protein n=1 Tax=Steroidobacter flavus TaxID=1842136 RepID=A0ABV8T1Y3_9GAMM
MSPRKPKINAQILEEAAEWFVEFDQEDIDLASRRRFDEWLRRSPDHVRAFLELVPVWEQGRVGRGPLAGDDPQSIIARALNAPDNVVSIKAGLESSESDQGTPRVKRRAWAALAASLLLCLFAGWIYSERNSYSTGIGEQRSFVLADGSVVELNARSRVRVRYSEHGRDVELLEGQALFQVAHDETRPFVVHSGDARVRAVGTQFDVYRKRTGTVVTVVEGRVTVASETAAPTPRAAVTSEEALPSSAAPLHAHAGELLLAAGEQATVTPHAVEPAATANVAAATAWMQRRLVFRKTTLAEVVEEFGRYNARSMRIADPQIQAFLISGTFSSTDPSSLIRFLREQPGMSVIETDKEIRIEAAP